MPAAGSRGICDISGYTRHSSTPPRVKTLFPESDDPAALRAQLRQACRVSYVLDSRQTLETWRDMMGTTSAMVFVFAVFSVAAGAVMIYSISIRERKNEFGALMILGMSGVLQKYIVTSSS